MTSYHAPWISLPLLPFSARTFPCPPSPLPFPSFIVFIECEFVVLLSVLDVAGESVPASEREHQHGHFSERNPRNASRLPTAHSPSLYSVPKPKLRLRLGLRLSIAQIKEDASRVLEGRSFLDARCTWRNISSLPRMFACWTRECIFNQWKRRSVRNRKFET